MADQVVIVGVGPGNMDMITPEALKSIETAEIIVGSRRILEVFAKPEQVRYELSGDLNGLHLNLTAWLGRKIVVLVSGDPGFYSILDWLKREFPMINLIVIPGISSIQLAFARLAQSWYDCKFISLHGREAVDLAREIQQNRKVCFLTDEKNTPAMILQKMKTAGIKDKWIFIGSSLGTPAEEIWQGRVSEYKQELNQPYSVVIVEDESLAI